MGSLINVIDDLIDLSGGDINKMYNTIYGNKTNNTTKNNVKKNVKSNNDTKKVKK